MLACFRQDPVSSKIYICACINKEERVQRIQDEPVFITSSAFYNHMIEKHEGVCLEGSSHRPYRLKNDKPHCFFRKSKHSKLH